MRNRNMSKGLKAILLSHYVDIPMQNNAMYNMLSEAAFFKKKTVIFFLFFAL